MATLKELADYVGLSVTTVSLVLRGEGNERKISKQSQDRIYEAARELGYHTNLSARKLRIPEKDRAIVVGVFWADDFREPMMMRFLRGLRKTVINSNEKFEITINPYENNRLSSPSMIERFNMCNAAIICNASQHDLDYLDKTNFSIPLVLYNRHSTKYSSVSVDDSFIGSMPAKIFASHGHKTAAMITSKSVFPGMEIRDKSFLQTIMDNNMNYIPVTAKNNSMEGGFSAAQDLLAKGTKPDCIFCASDFLAIGAMRAIHKANIRIPEDIEIISVGNGDREQEEYSYPSLSSMYIPMEQMAKDCFQLLVNSIETNPPVPLSIELPVEYIPRESCGKMLIK